MQGPRYVDVCKTNICLVPHPSKPDWFFVAPAIWHPSVLWPESVTDIKRIDDLNDMISAVKCPWNIEAGVQYHRDTRLFLDVLNERAHSIRSKSVMLSRAN